MDFPLPKRLISLTLVIGLFITGGFLALVVTTTDNTTEAVQATHLCRFHNGVQQITADTVVCRDGVPRDR